jgi:hypothetical protein
MSVSQPPFGFFVVNLSGWIILRKEFNIMFALRLYRVQLPVIAVRRASAFFRGKT